MGLIATAANWFVSKADNRAGIGIAPWLADRPYNPQFNQQSLIKRYKGWVYTCAHLNAVNCAQVPLKLYVPITKKVNKSDLICPTRPVGRKQKLYLQSKDSLQHWLRKADNIEEVTEHPFLDLMHSVNPFQNEFDLKEYLFLYLELTGNSYWLIINDDLGLPGQIWVLQPQRMRPIPSTTEFISGFEYRVSPVEKVIYKTEEIIHFKYPHPDDLFVGMGPLEAAAVAADLGFEMNTYETSLFKNRAQPDMAITLPAEAGIPNEDEIKRMQSQWRMRHAGTRKAGKIAVLTGGATLEKMSFTPKEMSFLQGRKTSLNEVASAFGIPMSKVTTENVNKANAEVGEVQYNRDTIRPKLIKVEQKINEQLMPRYDDNLFVAFDNPVPDDAVFALKEQESQLKTGYASINQLREKKGEEKVSWGEVPLLPMAIAPLGSIIVPEGGKYLKAPRKYPPLSHPTNFINEELVTAVQDWLIRQRDEILIGFDKDAETLGKSHYKLESIDDFLTGWFNLSKWTDEFDEALRPFWRATLITAGDRAMTAVTERGLEFDLLSSDIGLAIERRRLRSPQTVNTKLSALRKTLNEGITEGEGAVKLRNRILGLYEGFSKFDAVRIARTEVIWAFNEGAVQGYKQSGVITKKQWLTSNDERTCDWCPEMDGMTISIDVNYFEQGDSFTNSEGKTLDFAFEEIGHPPLHPMCRCSIVAVTEEF